MKNLACKSLVLLCGLPRSGTTWIAKITDAHPMTLYRHEPDSGGRLSFLPLIPTTYDVDSDSRKKLEQFARDLPYINDPKISASLPIFEKGYYVKGTYHIFKFLAYGCKVTSKYLRKISIPIAPFLNDLDNVTLVWKSIESTARLGLLRYLLPDLKIVLIIRNPCGYISSVLRGESQRRFSSSLKTSEDLEVMHMLSKTKQAERLNLCMQKIDEANEVQRLAWRWVLFNDKAIEELENDPAFMILNYDKFCRSPIEEAKKLYSFCGLEFTPSAEEFILRSTVPQKSLQSDYYSIRKNPLHAASRWKTELDQRSIEMIEEIVCLSRSQEYI